MSNSKKSTTTLPLEPLWYKDAIIYELHVRAFADSNGDGIGDFRGLISKLDYLHDLGVTALWLLPFYPSPLRDDGYDISDYTTVNPAYGTIRDFRKFLDEAHKRGLRVITELVINHTSSEHPWFQRARRSPAGSAHRDFYVWSDTPDRYRDARIIFQDFETSNWTWDPVARAYYWHRFYSHQPDLNFENPKVHQALTKVLDFWLGMGVDGMRLDAVPYLYEAEGTNCENLPRTHDYLKKLRGYIDSKYEDRMLLAEANQWPEDAASYFGDGDECHMNFHFPLMPRMFMALHQENNFPILDILEQTPEIPDNCQWAIFLRNHDELTLEMVTDEDRDYMYRVYAEDPRARINLGIRRRLAPLLRNHRKLELMTALLLSLPGTPVLYYGDEIGMGDNFYLGDRDAVRTPMQWSGDRNAGFSRANPQKLFLPVIIDPEYHYEAINVEAQQNNPQSLLWWTKRILDLRKHHQVFGRGTVEFLQPDNPKVLAFIREFDGQRVLVVANLSRFCQFVELDLRDYAGLSPIELFGHTAFPRIGELPYLLTLSPHGFYWLSLDDDSGVEIEKTPITRVSGSWQSLFEGRKPRIEKVIPKFLPRARWFRGKSRIIRRCKLVDRLAMGRAKSSPQLLLIQVEYTEGDPEIYLVPLAFTSGDHQSAVLEHHPGAVVTRLEGETEGLIYDATIAPGFADEMLAQFGKKRPLQGTAGGQLDARPLKRFKKLLAEARAEDEDLSGKTPELEQSNTNLIYGHHFVLKLFRRIEVGVNPDVELSSRLGEVGFAHVPAFLGHLEYQSPSGEILVAGVLQQFVSNQGDAWKLTLDHLDRYYADALSSTHHPTEWLETGGSLFERMRSEVPRPIAELINDYLPLTRLLGERTAELHLSLLDGGDDKDMAPEAFSTLHQRSLYQSGRSTLKIGMAKLRKARTGLPQATRQLADQVLDRRSELDARLKNIIGDKISAVRIRCHGDYHLGQVLFTGGDFYIIDFEGEPGRTLGERRIKRSPLRDVAGMLRSFHYAAVSARRSGHLREEDETHMEAWDELWYRWVSAAYLAAYLDRAGNAAFIPEDERDIEILLDFYRTEKCIYELSYELDNRPEWVDIPLRGLLGLLG